MKFDISVPPDRAPGLQVIPHIPNYPLCYLEGRNGIGKTVATKILELVTGAQPYGATPFAWRTLKEQLGSTRVKISDHPSGHVIEFNLMPHKWPDDPELGLAEELGDVTIDGSPANWFEARSMISVRRISGDETLVQTLAREVSERAVRAASLSRRLSPTTSSWDQVLHAVDRLTGEVDRESISHGWIALGQMTAELANAHTEAAAATAVWRAVSDASVAAEGLLRRRRDLPQLVEHLRQTGQELASTQDRLHRAEASAERAAIALAAGGSLRSQIEYWERLKVRRLRALQKAQAEQLQILRALDMVAPPTEIELLNRVREVAEHVDTILRRRDELDLAQPLGQLTQTLENSLTNAAPRLGEQIVANTRGRPTVNELLTGVRRRHAELAGQPKPEQLDRLDEELRVAKLRQRLLNALASAIRTTARKYQRVGEAESTLDRLFDQLHAGSRKEYEVAQAKVEEARTELIAAEVHRSETKKSIAEILGIQPLQSEAAPGPPNAQRGHDDDEADDAADDAGEERSVSDQLYPDLSVDEVISRAAALDQAAGSLLQPDIITRATLSASIAGVRDSADVPDIAHLVRACAQEPTQLLDQSVLAAVDLLRGLESDMKSATTVYSRRVEQTQAHLENVRQSLESIRSASYRAHVSLTDRRGEWSAWAMACAHIFDLAGAGGPSVPDLAVEPSAAELAVADALEAIRALAAAQTSAASSLPNNLAGLEGYLRSTAADLAPQRGGAAAASGSMPRPGDFYGGDRPALREWLESELASLLMDHELLAQLFDNASSIRLSLTDKSVTWRPEKGGVRKRPLEAFSSGEQVFAYTRANLARLGRERQPGQQLVVVLDEFGAFVARDRLAQLMAYVEHNALRQVADQVVVMLPLSRDYPTADTDKREADVGALFAAASGDTDELRQRQVRGVKYFAVPFSSNRTHLA